MKITTQIDRCRPWTRVALRMRPVLEPSCPGLGLSVPGPGLAAGPGGSGGSSLTCSWSCPSWPTRLWGPSFSGSSKEEPDPTRQNHSTRTSSKTWFRPSRTTRVRTRTKLGLNQDWNRTGPVEPPQSRPGARPD